MKQKEKKPLVSIIIPVYNGSNYMREAIDSAISQTYKNIEIIVINDGSTDNGETEKIARSYGKKIRYFSKENGGVSTALNFGIKKMKGDFFSWLSHDDRYYPDKIKIQIDYLIDNNLLDKKVMLYSNYDVINEKSEVINRVRFELYKPNDKPEYAMLHGLVSGISLLIPKKAFEEVGYFDEKYRCVQDYLLFSEMMKKYKFIFTTECTTSTRVHSKQVTNVNPNVIKENNFLWIKMQENVSDKRKEELEGSLYLFYKQMYNFLIENNDYKEAHEYTKNKMLEELSKEIDKLNKELDSKNICEVESEIKDLNNSKFICKWFKRIGKIETLNAIKPKVNRKCRSQINYKLYELKKINYSIEKETIIKKVKLCLKKDGFLKSIKKGIKYLNKIREKR